MDFISGIKDVPGTFEMMGRVVAGVSGPIEAFTQLMQVSKRAGLDAQATTNLASASYSKFGGSVKDLASDIANFHAAVAGTDIPISKAISQIQAAGEPLGIFGRKITETTNVWKTFTSSLTGVPIDAVGKLFTTVTHQIANMNLGTQAFVAQMSGMAHGATALGGALRMELEMRQPGGMERNLERVMQTISRMGGGRIVTLEEAARTPALEMQFQLQRQMAGQMLGIQGGQEQSRVLEVLRNIEQGGITRVDASKELQTMMGEGQSAQDKSNTLLDTIAQNSTLHTSLLKTLVDMEKMPKQRTREMGRALGTIQTGSEMQESHLRRAGYAATQALEEFSRSFTTAAGKVHRTLSRSVAGFTAGIAARRQELTRKAELATTGPVIDVLHPERTEPRMTAAPLPTATGRSLLFEPWRRPEAANTVLPVFPRPTMELPRAETARSGAPFAAPRPEGAEGGPEALTMTPLGAPDVKVTVICERCLEKRMYEIANKALAGARGEDHKH